MKTQVASWGTIKNLIIITLCAAIFSYVAGHVGGRMSESPITRQEGYYYLMLIIGSAGGVALIIAVSVLVIIIVLVWQKAKERHRTIP